MNGSRVKSMLAAAGLGYLGWRAWRKLRANSLAEQVVLITGGSRGLGLLMAREFAREGCRLAVCARDERELGEARRDLEGRGAEVVTIRCDVTNRDEVGRTVEYVTARFGGIDVLVNNASIIQVGPLETMTVEDFERGLAVNFWGGVYATLAVLPQMRARAEGRIVNITSIGGNIAVPHLLPYDCAKFAAVGFSQGLRSELAQHGIEVLTVVPGLMRTGSPVHAWFKGQYEKEFTWFSLGSATPLTAMSAPRAARLIVQATKRDKAEVTLSWQAKLLRLTHGVFPGVTADILGGINRLLPRARPESTREVRGMEISTPLSQSWLTSPMNRAAKKYHQYVGEPEPSPEHARKIGVPG